VLIENRNGLVVDTALVMASGTAERDAAVEMAARIEGDKQVTVGADKGYDTRRFSKRRLPDLGYGFESKVPGGFAGEALTELGGGDFDPNISIRTIDACHATVAHESQGFAEGEGLASAFHSMSMRFAHRMSLGVRRIAAGKDFLGRVPLRFRELRYALVTGDRGMF
jgi:hypothetical protein